MRRAARNVEWFDTLFDRDGRIKAGREPSGREGVEAGERVEAVPGILRALDADALLVVEAPDISRRRDGPAFLEPFAARAGIRARRALIGFANDTRQEVALLHEPDAVEARHDPREAADAPRVDRHLDVDLDGQRTRIRFSKPPLEAILTVEGSALRPIGVRAEARSRRAPDPGASARRAVASRRKLIGQCIWIRRRAEAHPAAGDALVVPGDFNGDPGLDAYEARHGRPGVGTVLGRGERALHDPHARRAIDGEAGRAADDGPVPRARRAMDGGASRPRDGLARPRGHGAHMAHLVSAEGAPRLRPLAPGAAPGGVRPLPGHARPGTGLGRGRSPGMRRIVLIAALLAAPASAQPEEGPGLVERGVEMMMRQLLRDMAPAMEDLRGTVEMLEGVIGEIENYEAPEMLPSGDIIIRRKCEMAPDIPPDGEIEL